jgi:hypothetical protein
MKARGREAVRDRPPTSIALILDTFWREHAEVAAVVFVDSEGECIDYCTSLDPFEAKLAGATWLDSTARMRRNASHVLAGELRQWVVHTDRNDFVVRRVTEEYVLVVQLSAEGLGARHLAALDGLVALLREDVGAECAPWNRGRDPWIGGGSL